MKQYPEGSPEHAEYYGKVCAYDRVLKHLSALDLV